MDMLGYIAGRFGANTNAPRYKALGRVIMEMIEEGRLTPGDRLPPIRGLAETLGVSNSTVVNAYRLLESKSYAYSITGSGTYVSQLRQTLYRELPLRREPDQPPGGLEGIINFANSNTSASLFPVGDFKALFNAVLERDRGDAFGYEEPMGFPPLREALRGYLEGFGVRAAAENIQIISGAQQGVDIIAKAFLRPKDNVIVENPTYYGAVGAFLSRGAVVSSVPLGEDGADIERLEQLARSRAPRLLYTMPHFQTPTGHSYSMEKKRALIELANKYNFYIVEEDNQSDFNYGREAVVPLKTLDYKNRVIYIKSFSKILMPGLRLGFMILPKAVLRETASARISTDTDTSGFIQRAFELFIAGGAMDAHIRSMRENFSRRYGRMEKALSVLRNAGFHYRPPGGGLSFWLELPGGLEAEAFCGRLFSRGVAATPGSVFSPEGAELPNIRLSFADTEEAAIETGVGIIAQAVKNP